MPERKYVRDLMSVGVPTCSPQTMVSDLARLFLEKGWEGVVVLDEHGHAVGVVTQDELVRAFAHEEGLSLSVEQVMRHDVPQIPPDIPLRAAAQLMQDRNLRVVFLMHHAGGVAYPAAMLTYTHLLRLMAAHNEEELSDLGIKAKRKLPLEAFVERRDAARKNVLSSGGERL